VKNNKKSNCPLTKQPQYYERCCHGSRVAAKVHYVRKVIKQIISKTRGRIIKRGPLTLSDPPPKNRLCYTFWQKIKMKAFVGEKKNVYIKNSRSFQSEKVLFSQFTWSLQSGPAFYRWFFPANLFSILKAFLLSLIGGKSLDRKPALKKSHFCFDHVNRLHVSRLIVNQVLQNFTTIQSAWYYYI